MDLPADSAAPPFEGITVPLAIEVAGIEVPLRRLQAVRQGAVLPLAGEQGRLSVRIRAGSQAIATGRIVAIGDGYGVLVERLVEHLVEDHAEQAVGA